MKKKSISLVLSIVLVCLMSVMLCACGQIDFVYSQNSDGTFTQQIIVSIDEDTDFSAYGYTTDNVIDALRKGFERENYLVSIKDRVVIATQQFESLDELKAAPFGNGIITDMDTVKEETNAFKRSVTINGDFVVSDNYLNDNAVMAIPVILMNGGITYSEAQDMATHLVETRRSYTFNTPYRSTTSNADTIIENSDGTYSHTWVMEANKTATITTSEVLGAMWYGIAIIAAVGVLLIVVIIKKAKEFKK